MALLYILVARIITVLMEWPFPLRWSMATAHFYWLLCAEVSFGAFSRLASDHRCDEVDFLPFVVSTRGWKTKDGPNTFLGCLSEIWLDLNYTRLQKKRLVIFPSGLYRLCLNTHGIIYMALLYILVARKINVLMEWPFPLRWSMPTAHFYWLLCAEVSWFGLVHFPG